MKKCGERRKIMTKPTVKIVFCFFCLFTLFFVPYQVAQAQEYPTKPVTLVNPMGAGGSHDLVMRAVTSVATDYFGQPMIVQIKAGGGGAIGSEFVVRAAPDGYTLLVGGPGWNSILPAIEGRSKGTGRSCGRLPDQLQPHHHRCPAGRPI